MPRQHINQTIQFILAASIILSIVFLISSARTESPFSTLYPGVELTPLPITGYWDIPAVWVTVIHPAIVSLPNELGGGEKVCMAVRFERGAGAAVPSSMETEPQSEWDTNPTSAILFSPPQFIGDANGTAQLRFFTPVLAGTTLNRLPYYIHWLGRDVIVLYDHQWAGGLLCYDFFIGETSTSVIPPLHTMRFEPINVHVGYTPTYNFLYGIKSNPKGIKSIELQKQTLSDYLAQIAIEAPFAVTPLHLETF